MRTPVAIVIAVVILAAALLMALRWEVFAIPGFSGGANGPDTPGGAFVLDRWTGNVSICLNPPPTEISGAVKGGRGIALHCKP